MFSDGHKEGNLHHHKSSQLDCDFHEAQIRKETTIQCQEESSDCDERIQLVLNIGNANIDY